MVKVPCDEEFPCDLVVLTSPHEDGQCHITTANLDGETNLKVSCCVSVLIPVLVCATVCSPTPQSPFVPSIVLNYFIFIPLFSAFPYHTSTCPVSPCYILSCQLLSCTVLFSILYYFLSCKDMSLPDFLILSRFRQLHPILPNTLLP